MLSGLADNDSKGKIAIINAQVWLWNLGFVVLLAALLFGFFPHWLDAFSWSSNTWFAMMIVVLVLVLQSYIQSLLLAYKRLKAFTWLSGLSVIMMVSVIFYTVNHQSLDVALYTYAGSQLLLLLVFLTYFLVKKLALPWQWVVSARINRRLLSFILMAGSVWMFTKLTDFVVRDYAIGYFGLAETGLWQACDRLSQGYRALYIATLSAVFYPQISDLLNNRRSLRPYIWSVYKHVLLSAPFFFLFLIVFRAEILVVFYATEFEAATGLFLWQITGDVFSFLAFPLSLLLMAREKTAWFISLQTISAIVYIAFILLFHERGVQVFVWAWAVRQMVYLITNILVNRKILTHESC